MTDLLLEAWNLLEPGERPEGMELDELDPTGCGWSIDIGKHLDAAHDRLIVAVESVLVEQYDLWLNMHSRGEWSWYDDCVDGHELVAPPDPDRLTAAVAALKAERSRT